jgi:hypothetical protein
MILAEKFALLTNKSIDKNTKYVISDVLYWGKKCAKTGFTHYTYKKVYYPTITESDPSAFSVNWDEVVKYFTDRGFTVENNCKHLKVKWGKEK